MSQFSLQFSSRSMPKVKHSNSCISSKQLGVKRVNQYVILKTIGTGASSSVVSCMVPSDKDDDKFFAMKIIKRAKLSSEMAELEALKRLLHDNIIRLYEIIDDPAMPNLYLVMDIITGGTIEDKIKDTADGLAEAELWKWTRQLSSAVFYCHNVANICHRDLKAENAMLNKTGDAVLVDFGVSACFEGENDKVRGTEGSIKYFAPEMVRTGVKKIVHARRTDVWALGVTFFNMATNKFPFNA